MTSAQREEYRKAFDKFDEDGSGTLTFDELMGIFTRPGGGAPLTEEEAKEFIRKHDKNGDGVLSIEEFVASVLGSEEAKAVFASKEYARSWELVPPDRVAEVEAKGVALKTAWTNFESNLKNYLFYNGGQGPGWDRDKLCYPDGDAHRLVLGPLKSLINNEAKALVDLAAELAQRAYDTIPGSGDPPPLTLNEPSGADDVQPALTCHESKWFWDDENNQNGVKYADLPPEAQATVTKAVELCVAGQPELTREDVQTIVTTGNEDFDLCVIVANGPLGDPKNGYHVNTMDNTFSRFLWGASPKFGNGVPRAIDYLFMEMLLLSQDFHKEMAAVLSPYGEYAPAPMKAYNRAWAKCSDSGDGYKSMSKPQSRHLKDILRASLYVSDHASLVAAHKELIAKFPPAGTKDRRTSAPRDVLQVVRFKGYLVELQFHFKDVVAIKKLSHVGYNIARCNEGDNAFDNAMYTVFNFYKIDGKGGCKDAMRDDLTCKMHFE